MALGLGFSFGKKKASGSGTSTIDSLTELSGTQQQSSVQSGTTTTSTQGTTQQAGTQSQATETDQTQSQSGTTRQLGTTTSLGQDVIDALSNTVKQVLGGGVTDANIASLSNMIAGKGDFNADSFVEGVVGQARNRGEQTLQEQDSAFASRVGGTAKTNSMAALLAQRGRNDLEANLAGIQAQARGQAEQIENENIGAAAGGQQAVAGIASNLAEAAKGGATTTDVTSLTEQLSQLLGREASLGTTASTTSASETSSTNQLLAQIAEVLTQQAERQTGTETQTQKTKSGGFGLSLGI